VERHARCKQEAGASDQSGLFESGAARWTLPPSAFEHWHGCLKAPLARDWYSQQLSVWRRNQFEETVVIAVIGLSGFAGILGAFCSALTAAL